MEKRKSYWPANRPLAVDRRAFGLELLLGGPAIKDNYQTGQCCVVTIRGPLSHHADGMCDSYDDIQCRFDAALESSCPDILLCLDTPGGDVAGCFELSAYMRQAARAKGRRLLAYVEGQALSAGYAIASAAQAIGVGQTSFVGSIGIIQARMSQAVADSAMGLQFEFITSGERKSYGNPHTPISEQELAVTQSQVDDLALVFYTLVSGHRPRLTPEVLKGLQAGLFFGQGAVSAGLADRQCTWEEMVSYPSISELAQPIGEAAMSVPTDKPRAEGEEKPDHMGKAKESLAKLFAEGDDDMRKKVARALKALDEKEEPKSEGEPKEEKAEDKKEEPAKALAAPATPEGFDLAQRVFKLEAENQTMKETQAKAALFALRPDFDDKVKALMSKWSLAQVKEAVENFPKAAPANLAAASQVVGKRGDAEGGDNASGLDADTVAHIHEHMYGQPKASGVERARGGRELIFRDLSREEALVILAKHSQKGAQ